MSREVVNRRGYSDDAISVWPFWVAKIGGHEQNLLKAVASACLHSYSAMLWLTLVI